MSIPTQPISEQRPVATGDEGNEPRAPIEPRILVDHLYKRFERVGGEEVLAIDDISLRVMPGEFLVLLGPSGCGKTTLLRCLAGLERPDGGEIELAGRTVFSRRRGVNLPPEKRAAGMMFQSYALWPHMTVFDNIAYPLRTMRQRHTKKSAVKSRVIRALELVHCGHLADQYPSEISGGQQQRIALARALVRDDSVVFFDEPLSNVDAQLREELRIELRSLQEEIGFSAIYVTHDQLEALALADRVVLLRQGRIAQIGSPRDVYNEPESSYVARFMGSVNECRGVVVESSGRTLGMQTDLGALTITCPNQHWSPGDRVIAMCRPAATQLLDHRPMDEFAVECSVRACVFLGTHFEVIVDVQGATYRVWLPSDAGIEPGSSRWLSMPRESIVIVADDSEPQTTSV